MARAPQRRQRGRPQATPQRQEWRKVVKAIKEEEPLTPTATTTTSTDTDTGSDFVKDEDNPVLSADIVCRNGTLETKRRVHTCDCPQGKWEHPFKAVLGSAFGTPCVPPF
ncbi:unnamed protein product [Vitrella brassicaformis CCMP3155]|uniref:Uncharacterized protein n=1 Tax=Vitrella brassicaformis (strain CCMP3155) TaxID=1169540 RepID=A0A0G4EP29_VITBC|nr:unnamed protein product [Vitrella brassicaformis CCMP3155]|eukprot:CEL99565.1 unnamed protein product [Vitrella brassicaformis CCMP3155]